MVALTRAFGTTQRVVGMVLEVTILLYFLLAAGDFFLQKLIKVLPGRSEKKQAVQIARETEASISAYLLTTLSVNLVEGAVVAGVMYGKSFPVIALEADEFATLESGTRLIVEPTGVVRRG